VIAGGAIRDLLLAEEPVKDLDIFVLDPSVRDLGSLTSAYGEPPYRPYFVDDDELVNAVFLEPMRVRDSLEQRLVCAAIEPTPYDSRGFEPHRRARESARHAPCIAP
jgi:hypothetical protein